MIVDHFVRAALDEARGRAVDAQGKRGLRLLSGLGGGPITVAAAPGVGTARLRQGAAGPVIEVDPAFLDAHVRRPADALHLLGHELLHRVRGNLCRFVAVDRAAWTLFNLALDVFVDAHLERLWFRGDGAPYQRRLYAADRFPDLLLLPPRRLLADIGGAAARRFLALGPEPFVHRRVAKTAAADLATAVAHRLGGLDVRDPKGVAELYADGWLNLSDFAAFWRRFRSQLRDELPAIQRGGLPLLLGDHAAPGSRDPFLDELSELFEEVFGTRYLGGRGFLSSDVLEPLGERPDPGPLLATLLRAVEADPHSPTNRARLTPERGVVPCAGRREIFSLAAGHTPVFWRSAVPRVVEEHERVHLYVDASGSMDRWLPFLFRLCGELAEHVGSSVQLFSNVVVDTTLRALSEGCYNSTGGTDFDCVLDDVLSRGWRSIVLVTDGWAGVDGGLLGRALSEGLTAYVVLLGDGVNVEHPLTALPGGTWCWSPEEPQA